MIYVFLISVALFGILCLMDDHEEIMKDSEGDK